MKNADALRIAIALLPDVPPSALRNWGYSENEVEEATKVLEEMASDE